MNLNRKVFCVPIFSTDEYGGQVRWTSKRDLRSKLDDMAERFVAERLETGRLRRQIESDNVAWNHLMESHQELDVALAGSHQRADMLATTLDLANAKNAHAASQIDALCADNDGLVRQVRILRQQTYDRVAAITRAMESLRQACNEADEARSHEGRAGRIGTKTIRAIFGW